MLAIKKRPEIVKVLATGSLAFAVGLTGVAAYLNSTSEHQNLVFNKEQSETKDDSGQVAGASTTRSTASDTGTGEAMSPQAADTSLATAPASSSNVQGGTSATVSEPSVTSSPISPSPTPAPAGSTEPPQITTPPPDDGGGVIIDPDPVIDIVDGVTDGLGL